MEKAGKIWYIVLTQGWLTKYGPKIDGKVGRSFQELGERYIYCGRSAFR